LANIPEVTIIIPAYNEKSKLSHTVDIVLAEINNVTPFSEIIIAEDGSNDGTYELAREIAQKAPNIRLIHSNVRQGKGRALTRAIKSAEGNIVCYVDADLATDMSYLLPLLNAIREDGYDLVTGSRLMPMSEVQRSHKRSIASKIYNLMVRLILKSKIYDHQCGFKAFKRASALNVLDQVKGEHWFWDTEFLVRCQRNGFMVKELPVKWIEADSTTVDLAKDVYRMGLQILWLWWDLYRN